jgi:hypothetical protein
VTHSYSGVTPASRPDRAGSSVGLLRSWVSFWFTPADPIALNGLRLLAGLLFLSWLLTLAGHREALFGLEGWFDHQAYREAASLPQGTPAPVGWSVLYLCGTSRALLNAAYWLAVAVLVLFTLGLWTRLTAVLTWVAVVSFAANPALSYGADQLLGIVAFYLMVGHVLQGPWCRGQSLSTRLLGPASTRLLSGALSEGPARCSYAANLAVRLLQVHFAIVVWASGLHKLQFGDWWAGLAFWYPLHPPLETTAALARAHAANATVYLFLLSLAQYALLAWQVGFPLFAWRRSGRALLLGGALVGWAGSVFLYRQPLYGPVLVIGCLSYLSPDEWRRLLDRCRGVFRRPVPAHAAAEWLEPSAEVGQPEKTLA